MIINKFTEAASVTQCIDYMENVLNYVAPQVELIEVEVERGFEGSTGTGGTGENMGWG